MDHYFFSVVRASARKVGHPNSSPSPEQKFPLENSPQFSIFNTVSINTFKYLARSSAKKLKVHLEGGILYHHLLLLNSWFDVRPSLHLVALCHNEFEDYLFFLSESLMIIFHIIKIIHIEFCKESERTPEIRDVEFLTMLSKLEITFDSCIIHVPISLQGSYKKN